MFFDDFDENEPTARGLLLPWVARMLYSVWNTVEQSRDPPLNFISSASGIDPAQ